MTKVIKSIAVPRFTVELIQSENSGSYYVGYINGNSYVESQSYTKISEPVTDLKTALFLFDLKIKDLEGN